MDSANSYDSFRFQYWEYPTKLIFNLCQYWSCEAMVTLKKINMGIDKKISKKINMYITFIIKLQS